MSLRSLNRPLCWLLSTWREAVHFKTHSGLPLRKRLASSNLSGLSIVRGNGAQVLKGKRMPVLWFCPVSSPSASRPRLAWIWENDNTTQVSVRHSWPTGRWSSPREKRGEDWRKGGTQRGPHLNSARVYYRSVRDTFLNTSFSYFYLKGSYL